MLHGRHLAVSLAAGLAAAVLAGGAFSAAEPPAKKVKVLFVRSGGHDWKALSPLLVDVMHKTGDFEVTLSEDVNDFRADRIGKYDVVMYTGSGTEFADADQEKGLCDFVRNGGAFVGIHGASDAFKKSDAYWELVGGRFAGHGSGKFPVRIYDKEHPITAGLEDFEIQDETYSHAYHKNLVMRCLVRMDQGNDRQSMAWVQDYGKGRVFFTSLGHGKEAWENPHFQRLVVRGAYWAAGRAPRNP